nr:RHS repeat-associated core domain-containing protein [Streptomyces sp. SID3343]
MSPLSELAATTEKTGGAVLQLANLHGDVVVSLPLSAPQSPVVRDFDEFGTVLDGDPTARYGWLGANQRSSETPLHDLLMGVRMYDPAAGRFLSTDPVPGGSATAYDYADQDPINQIDLTGKWSAHHRDACYSNYGVGLRKVCDDRQWRSVDWYFRITNRVCGALSSIPSPGPCPVMAFPSVKVSTVIRSSPATRTTRSGTPRMALPSTAEADTAAVGEAGGTAICSPGATSSSRPTEGSTWEAASTVSRWVITGSSRAGIAHATKPAAKT